MRKISLLRIFFGLSALEGLITLIWQLRIPSDPKNAWLFGFSLQRIAMVGAILFGLSVLIVLSLRTWKDEVWGLTILDFTQKKFSSAWVFNLILCISGLIASFGVYTLLFFINDLADDLWYARLLRLMPIIVWLIIINFQVLIFFPFLRGTQPQAKFTLLQERSVWRASIIALLLIICVSIFIAVTQIGLQPIGDWETIGVPLSFVQVVSAFFIAIYSLIIFNQLGRVFQRWFVGSWKDIVLGLIIWGVAIFAWQAIPMKPTFNAPKPSPPNYEYYPHSGAAWQDAVSQNLIIGEGYKLDFENEKPIYTLFLAGLHLLGGQDYERVVNLQIVFTALFPVVLFVFGKISFNRLTGLILAVLAIMRERNALTLMSEFDISHSKLLLTDMPGTLLLAIFILISFLWLLKLPRNRLMAFLSGGLLGLSMLIRNQSLILLLVVGITLVIILRREWKKAATGILVFCFGVLVAIFPWMWRNYQVTGHFFTVLPDKGWAIVQRFRTNPDIDPQFEDINTFEEGVERLIDFSFEHPIEMAEFLTAHFLHNEISTILTLPASFSSCCSMTSYVDDLSYWGKWDGKILSNSLIPISVNIILISIGLGVAWKTNRVVGLYPLFLHLIYNFSSVIWGISGWRFILPVDWVGIYYYCVGLVYLALLVFTFYTGKVHQLMGSKEYSERSIQTFNKRGWVLGVIILGIGLIIPIAEGLFPQRYTQLSKSEAVSVLEENLSLLSEDINIDPAVLLDDPTIEVYLGRGLYPRYYPAGKGEPGTAFRWPAHTTREYNRLGFYLAGPDNWAVILPLDQVPQFFPNAQDVLVFGCQVENYLIGQVVVILDSPPVVYRTSQLCSSFDQ